MKYVASSWGLIDLFAILPTYLAFFYPAIHVFTTVRIIRLIRIFRVFKLSKYLSGGHTMIVALKSSRPKIIVFLSLVILLSIVLGTLMYIVEGSTPGFGTIPDSIYWAIVTLTTVGYGDIVPVTILGKMIASFIMILGYGIIAVPTGIVSSEITKERMKK
jgi:voltage-gated potassium channel